jgi:hypothetical protein
MRTWTNGGAAALAAGLLSLALCIEPASAQGISDTLRNLLRYGSTTEPPAAPQAGIEVEDCPRVDVTEGGAALRTYAGGRTGSPEALRSQLTISNVARECIGRPDGSIVVKVGVEGRALIGPAGSPGRFDAPIRVVVKRGEQVFANRLRRIPVAVPPGEAHGTFVTVEEGIVIPPGTGDFDIEVGLGGGAGEKPAKGQRGRQRG